MSICCVNFEHTYKWDQIFAESDPTTQIAMLEANTQALEDAVTNSGSCPLEIPYRWSQFWEGLLAGEAWAIACAEENDRAIEARFNECTCASSGFTVTFTGSSVHELFTSWAGAFDAGFTTLTLESIAVEMDFHPDDVAYITLHYENLTDLTFSSMGEGSYDATAPYTLPERSDIRNFNGPTSVDHTNLGPYPTLRDVSDPFYRPLTDFAATPYLDLMTAPVEFTVDEYTEFGVTIIPDYGRIPGYIGDAENPDVAWSGTVTFQFAEAGEDVVVTWEE